MNPGLILVRLISLVVQVINLLIIADVLLTWFPQVDRRHPVVVALRRLTEPIYRPIRRIIPPEKTGYIDLSPVIAIFLIIIIGNILQGLILRFLVLPVR
ncbi:MAG: YggT family protein [Armatimonadota bacterium]|nr:YggT family protein [bacterium]